MNDPKAPKRVVAAVHFRNEDQQPRPENSPLSSGSNCGSVTASESVTLAEEVDGVVVRSKTRWFLVPWGCVKRVEYATG